MSNPCSQMCCSRLRGVFLLPHGETVRPSHGPQSPVSAPYLLPSPLPSFCPRFRDLSLLLKLSELLAFCLVSVFPKLDLSSLPHSVQVSAQTVPHPRGLLRPQSLSPPPSLLRFFVAREIDAHIIRVFAYCGHPSRSCSQLLPLSLRKYLV